MTELVIDGVLVAMRPVESGDIPYLAGIIDGEGTIYYRAPTRSLQVRVTNTHRPLLDWIAARWGGGIHVEADYNTDGHTRKPKWRWTLSGQPAVDLLRALQPHLIVKADKAVEGLKRWENR